MAKTVSKCPVCDKKLVDHTVQGLVVCMKKTNLKEYKPRASEVRAFEISNQLRLITTHGQPSADKGQYSIQFHGQKDPIITRDRAHTIYAFMLATMVEKIEPDVPEGLVAKGEDPETEYWEKEAEDAEREDPPQTLED